MTAKPHPTSGPPTYRNPMPILGAWTGREVKALRGALRLSVRGLAQHLGINGRVVSKWEAGATPCQNNQNLLDTALRCCGEDAQRRFRALLVEAPGGATVLAGTGLPQFDHDEHDGWTLHLLVDVADVGSALRIADAMCATLAANHPEVVVGITTLNPAGHDHARKFIYCDRRLAGGTDRCGRRYGHRGECGPHTGGNSHPGEAEPNAAGLDAAVTGESR